MAELAPTDVQTFTNGRLLASDANVARMLNAALAVARREVGWHVSPVKLADAIDIDGPDSRILWLPTRKVIALTSITEDGTLIDPSKYSVSKGTTPGLSRPVAVRKKDNTGWTDQYGGIHIVMDHGFTETEAVDWRQAILAMVDQMSLVPVMASTGSSNFGLRTKQVDDVRYQWEAQYAGMAEDVIFSVMEILEDFTLPTVEFF